MLMCLYVTVDEGTSSPARRFRVARKKPVTSVFKTAAVKNWHP